MRLLRVPTERARCGCSAPGVRALAEAAWPIFALWSLLFPLLFGLACASAAADLAATAPPAGKRGWSVTERDGVFWLVDPEGQLFFSKGVNVVNGGSRESARSRVGQAYFWGHSFPSLEAWRRSAGEQLLGWGFNTLGAWSDPSPEIPLAMTVNLELGRRADFHWFDPFHPAMEQRIRQLAEDLTAPYRHDRRLIGYFTDNEIGWWSSPLFEWFLGKGWENHTKRVLWELMFRHYAGRWDLLLRDWVPGPGPVLGRFEDLKRAEARLKLRPGGSGILLVDRFLKICARRYYELTSAAIRNADPRALVLGDRLPLYYHQDAVLAMADQVDVISTNYNVDAPDGWVAPYYFEGLLRLARKPVLVTEFFFAAEENRSGNRNETARSEHPDPGHLMTVATQAERARGTAQALANFARFPNVVGTHWFQHSDEPRGGREDGEDYNMGLVDNANRPYEELAVVFKELNPQLEARHRSARAIGASFEAGPFFGEESGPGGGARVAPIRIRSLPGPIDLADQSLADWNKEQSRLAGFRAPAPYVPFGDVHLCWSTEGLYLAGLANTYVNAGFLACGAEFPPEECFQLHLWIELEGRPRHFAVYLQPVRDPRSRDGFRIRTRLCRLDGTPAPEPMPAEGHVQRIEKTLPHMAFEAFLPCAWLGVDRLGAGVKARMDVLAVSFHRELAMSWRREPPERLQRPDEAAPVLRPVILEP
ncbi:MAG: hypothetical protein AB1640_25955 [bacterium]